MTRGIVVDIAGQRFGRLTVVEIVGVNYKNERIWRCVCDCGKEKNVYSSSLRYGSQKSCGCYRVEWASDKRRACNDSYFSVPNLENSYWAGFIAADGNIHQRKALWQKKLGIGLSAVDLEHLESFVSVVEYKGKISKFNNNKGKPIVSIGITSSELCGDLERNFNITPKKSLVLMPPDLGDETLIKAFIKGYIDGDGSMGIYRGFPRLTVIGTMQFVGWIRGCFEDFYSISLGEIKNYSRSFYTLYVTSNNCRKVLADLYSLPTHYLSRKWDKMFV